MLQPGPSGSIEPLAVLYIVVKALLAIGLWGGAAIGFLLGPLNALERVVAFAAAALLVAALPLTDELGFAACGAFVLWHWLRVRRARIARAREHRLPVRRRRARRIAGRSGVHRRLDALGREDALGRVLHRRGTVARARRGLDRRFRRRHGAAAGGGAARRALAVATAACTCRAGARTFRLRAGPSALHGRGLPCARCAGRRFARRSRSS